MSDARAPDAPIALVTGGLHRIGAGIAGTLADAGYRLALHGRSDADVDPGIAVLLDDPSMAQAFHADLTDPAAATGLIDAVAAQFGMVPHLLINNASLFEAGGWDAADPAALARHMQVNCLAPVTLARAIAAAGRGTIVNILDQRVAQPVPDQFAYTLSKQALWQATRTMAVAFAPHVRVNAVAPGPTLPSDDYSDADWARVGAMLPLGHHASVQSIAQAVLYLARADDVTGQTIFVDGGASLKGWDRDFVYL